MNQGDRHGGGGQQSRGHYRIELIEKQRDDLIKLAARHEFSVMAWRKKNEIAALNCLADQIIEADELLPDPEPSTALSKEPPRACTCIESRDPAIVETSVWDCPVHGEKPEPRACGTCGSDNPARCCKEYETHGKHEHGGLLEGCCMDSFHDPVTSGEGE